MNIFIFLKIQYLCIKLDNNQPILYAKRFLMGNTEDSYTTRFHSKYNFIEIVDDDVFGVVKIYRKKQINFDYVMVMEKFVNRDNQNFFSRKIECIHASFFKQKQPNILTVFHYSPHRQSITDCGAPMFRMYVEYLNYTFRNFLQENAKKNQLVTYNEILYVLNKIIDTYEFFTSNGLGGFAIDIDKIFLTTQGWVKVSPFKSDDFLQLQSDTCLGRCQTSSVKRSINLQHSIGHFSRELKRLISNIIDEMICISQKVPLKNLQNNLLKVRTIHQLKVLIHQSSLQFINLEKRIVINDLSDTQITNDKNKRSNLQKIEQPTHHHIVKKFRKKI